jgi:hypothetical protein
MPDCRRDRLAGGLREDRSKDKAVAALNIEHHKKRLVSETDAAKRETIGRLLADGDNHSPGLSSL